MDVQRLISDFEENLNDFSCWDDFIETKAELQNSFNLLKKLLIIDSVVGQSDHKCRAEHKCINQVAK